MSLPANFRKLPLDERRNLIRTGYTAPADQPFFDGQQKDLALADRMVENAVGWFEVPLGVVPGLTVNGKTYDVPLATEEPSVVAAASYAARILTRSQERGLAAGAGEPLMGAQIFLEPDQDFFHRTEEENRFLCRSLEGKLETRGREILASMEKRGGGWRGCRWVFRPDLGIVQLEVLADVRDALGANLVNTLAEGLSPLLEEALKAKKLMAILSNDASDRPAWAEFTLGVDHLARAGFSGGEMARRIVLASNLAQADHRRAVTHNKGIMNGISALALATGNDTRALEAAVHSGASRSGTYRGLSRYRIEEGFLKGRIDVNLALATVGGAVSCHPAAQTSLRLLGNPDSRELCTLAAALGLAQNFAALWALTAEGIQQGHMGLHQRRLS